MYDGKFAHTMITRNNYLVPSTRGCRLPELVGCRVWVFLPITSYIDTYKRQLSMEALEINDILYSIFTFLDVEDLIFCERVCSRWRTQVNNEHLWSKLYQFFLLQNWEIDVQWPIYVMSYKDQTLKMYQARPSITSTSIDGRVNFYVLMPPCIQNWREIIEIYFPLQKNMSRSLNKVMEVKMRQHEVDQISQPGLDRKLFKLKLQDHFKRIMNELKLPRTLLEVVVPKIDDVTDSTTYEKMIVGLVELKKITLSTIIQ